MATVVELIKEHIPDPNKINYNPVVHGPDGLTEEALHRLAVRSWLVNLTGKESPEDVVAVTSYGWELGLSGSFMLPQTSKDIPFERLRIDTINELSRITYGK